MSTLVSQKRPNWLNGREGYVVDHENSFFTKQSCLKIMKKAGKCGRRGRDEADFPMIRALERDWPLYHYPDNSQIGGRQTIWYR